MDAKRVTRNKFRTEQPYIIDTAVRNSDAMATWRMGFVHSPALRCIIFLLRMPCHFTLYFMKYGTILDVIFRQKTDFIRQPF